MEEEKYEEGEHVAEEEVYDEEYEGEELGQEMDDAENAEEEVEEEYLEDPGEVGADTQEETKSCIAAVESDIYTKGGAKREMSVKLKHFASMEESFAAGPLSINVLGQLCVIAAAAPSDFPLLEPAGGFKHLKHGESFKASLAQVSNTGHAAFLAAHFALEKIEMTCEQVPSLMKTTSQILFEGSDEEVAHFVPDQLKEIEEISLDCTTFINDVVVKFEDVIFLLDEFYECGTATKGANEQELAEVQRQKLVLEMDKKQTDASIERLQKEHDEAKDRAIKASEDYDQAMDDIPTGGELIGARFADMACNLIEKAVPVLLNAIPAVAAANTAKSVMGGGSEESTEGGNNNNSGNTHPNDGGPKANNSDNADIEATIQLLDKTLENTVPSFFVPDESGGYALNNDLFGAADDGANNEKSPKTLLLVFEREKKNLGEVENGTPFLLETAKGLCDEAITFMQSIVDMEMTQTPEEINEVHATLQKVQEGVNKLAANKGFIKQAPQFMEDAIKNAYKNPGSEGSTSSADLMVKNAQRKVAVAREVMQAAREQQERMFQDKQEKHDKLSEILQDILSFDIQETSLKDILPVIKQALGALAQLKASWVKLLMFFKSISNIISIQLSGPMSKFAKDSEKLVEFSNQGKGTSTIMKKAIWQCGYEAVKYSYVVQEISETYVDISRRYYIPMLDELPVMLAMEDKDELEVKKGELNTMCEEALAELETVVQEKMAQMKEDLETRESELEESFANNIPKDVISQEEMDEIEAEAKDTYNQTKQQINYDDF